MGMDLAQNARASQGYSSSAVTCSLQIGSAINMLGIKSNFQEKNGYERTGYFKKIK